jgi:hypothetical protein
MGDAREVVSAPLARGADPVTLREAAEVFLAQQRIAVAESAGASAGVDVFTASS